MNTDHSNRSMLLWASFFTLVAAGVGFAIRGGILGAWAADFGFTKTDLGTITGGGLVGFGFIILLASLIVDRVGYKPLLLIAFVLHIVSLGLTLAATPVYEAMGKGATYQCLYWGMFLFAVANGICEAVINPLVATLYPKEKTHYLNILHAGWPAGLVLGGFIPYFLGASLSWEIQISFFILPTFIYGFMVIKEKFPISEARAAGVDFGGMLVQFASPILLCLLVLHAMVGYVELGTDSWIASITGSIMASPEKGMLLFVYTSGLMFALRFFAGPIVHRISPLGLLCVSGVIGAIGLTMLGGAETVIACVVAATIYALGKTFLWPTMLGVVAERFPRGGALTLGAIGGVGMLSAGLLGGPGIGYDQDKQASIALQASASAAYDRYASAEENSFLFFPAITGLDGAKVATLGDEGAELAAQTAALEADGKSLADDENLSALAAWWEDAKQYAAEDAGPVAAAGLDGGRKALKITAAVPATMAVIYFLLIMYFKSKGGYAAIHLTESNAGKEEDGDS